MGKTAVYSWRVDPEMKDALEEIAQREGISVARLLDRIVGDWLREESTGESEEEKQERIRAKARKAIGTLEGGDPYLAQEVEQRIRDDIRKRYGRQRAD